MNRRGFLFSVAAAALCPPAAAPSSATSIRDKLAAMLPAGYPMYGSSLTTGYLSDSCHLTAEASLRIGRIAGAVMRARIVGESDYPAEMSRDQWKESMNGIRRLSTEREDH